MIRRVLIVTFLFLAYLVSPAFAEKGVARIRATQEGKSYTGNVLFEDTDNGLKVSAELQGFVPGDHGFHIHQFGDCSDTGKAAGGHYNPDGAPHGLITKDGVQHAHAGDMGNVTIGPDGTGKAVVVIPALSLLSGPYAVAGRSVIVHENKDDFSQPLGNAGSRVGCGEIVISS